MSGLGLSDLDDLALTVRDRNSRSYIGEAIRAYRGGAYRSAIMSTWIAVAYDIISKIRELAGQGDGAAVAFVTNLDAAIADYERGAGGAVQRLQNIENDLLPQALTAFEFLSVQEHSDLERLKADRNLCAHPAFTSQSLLFQPSPELVRTHLVHAITHLLCHPPVQGQSALARLKADLMQPSFPGDQAGVSAFMEHRYLNHVKDSLLDNFVTVFLKILLKQSEPDLIGKENSVLRCLVAVQAHSPARYERKMAEQIPALTDRLPDPDLKRVLRLFRVDRRCWDWLTEPLRIRLRRVIETYTYDAGDSDYVFEGLVIDDLRPVLLRVFAALRDDYKMVLISRNPRQEFVAEGIGLYEEIGSWRQAELVAANVIMPLTPYLTAADVERIAQAIINVHDIRTAHASPELVSRIFQETPHLRAATQATWGELLRQLNERGQAFTALRTALTEAGVPLPPA